MSGKRPMCYRRFSTCLLLFIGLNLLLYGFVLAFHDSVSFSWLDYQSNAYHFLADARIQHGRFRFLRALGQYDAQWYLRIASLGYSHVTGPPRGDPRSLSYAFFPLFPLTIRLVSSTLSSSIELAAFLVVNALLLVNFISLYLLVQGLHDAETALKAGFLLFFFPFSVFYRSYFTEGLFLFLLICFAYSLWRRRLWPSAALLSLLSVTRPNGITLAPLFLWYAIDAVRCRRIRVRTLIGLLGVAALPFLAWLVFCYTRTGDPLYWMRVQGQWFRYQDVSFPLLHNLNTMLHFLSLPVHSFHASKVDALTAIAVGILLYISVRELRPELWWISFSLWIVPLLTRDTMSYTRYQAVSFPLFIYLAHSVKGYTYLTLFGTFLLILFPLSLYFVNWHWIG